MQPLKRLRDAGFLGKIPRPTRAWALYASTALLWALRLAPFPSGILDLMRYPWVADTTRLKTVFGYTPRHSSRQALEAFAARKL